MARDRDCRDDSQSALARVQGGNSLQAAETLRSSAECASPPQAAEPRVEERISVFWRVFGGTLLSIAALVCITIYQQFSGSLNDLRRDLNHQNETRADLVKKDDFNNRISTLWNSIKELSAVSTGVSALTERSKLLELQLDKQHKAVEEERREICRRMEEQRKVIEEERRDFHRKLEEQRKLAEDERRELNQKLQTLAERLAKVEGQQTGKAMLQAPVTAN
jgi:DNA repair exonuclease SbcCD ATPase subunit